MGAILIGTLAAATITTPAHADPPPGSTAPASYKLVFSDDFNGTSLDSNAWRTRRSSWVSDGNVKVAGGNLSIDQTRVSTANTETSSFRGGGIATKKRFGYGYYEARVKLPPEHRPLPPIVLDADLGRPVRQARLPRHPRRDGHRRVVQGQHTRRLPHLAVRTTITPGTTYQLSFELDDARLIAKLNGTEIMNVADRSLTEGKWGVKGYNQPFSVDDLAMKSP
ncbi:glycoside hydrolase family 16 protein [Streptomyces sp. NPDC054919]